MIWLWIVLLSVVSACLYRMGGCGPADLQAEWGWVPAPIRNFPKKRDVGCALCAVGAGLLIGIQAPWWAWLISFGLMWGALSTYWDELLGHDNFFAHGLGIGLAMFPVGIFDEPVALGVRAVVLALTMGLWAYGVDNYGKSKPGFRSDRWSELGRGALIILTMIIVVLM